MNRNNIRKKILIVFSLAFITFFSIIVVNTIFFNRTIQVNFSIIVMLVSTILLYVLGYVIYIFYRKKKNKKWDFSVKPMTLVVIGIIVFGIQMLLANLTYAHCGWDCGGVVSNAFELYSGKPIATNYFAIYPNNIALLLLFKYILVVVGFFQNITSPFNLWVTIVFNIIVIDMGVIFTILTCKKLLGNKAVWLSLIFLIPLVIFSPYINIPYTDTLTMFFPITMFFFYLKIKEKTKYRYLWYVVEGMLVVAGIVLKPTIIIIWVAIFIGEIFYAKKSENLKNTIFSIVIMIILVILGASIIYGGYDEIKKKNIDPLITEEQFEEQSVSITHFFMMGMQERAAEENVRGKNNILYGAYNGNDTSNTVKIQGKKAKTEYNLSVVKQRLQNFGALGYLYFLYQKANWILCDGTFFYGGEGTFFITDSFNTSPIGKILQNYTNIEKEEYQNVTANIMQTTWILLLVGLLFSYKKQEKLEIKKNLQIAQMAIIGIILFNLLFEGRARYLINHLPFFILVGTYGLKNSYQWLYEKINKLNERKR